MRIIITLIIGAVAGWLGSAIIKGDSLGVFGNMVVGIIGSFVGYWVLGKLGIHLGTGWIGAVLTGAVGAVIVLLLARMIFKKR